MKRIIRHSISIVLLICFGFLAYAQEPTGRIYVGNNANGSGISVRWVGPEISYQEGVKLYRKQGNKEWELITPGPIMPPTSIRSDLNLTSNQRAVLEAFIKQDHKEFLESIGSMFTLIESIKSYEVALGMNIAYNDLTAETGKKYQYKAEATLKGKTVLIGTSKTIKCEPFAPVQAPQGVTFDRKRKVTQMWWTNDEDQYYSYNVYLKGPNDTSYILHTSEIGAGNLGEQKNNFLSLKTHKDSLYSIKLEARDYFGQMSVMSEEIAVPMKDLDPIVPPKPVLEASAKTGSIKITWQTPKEDDLAEINILRMVYGIDTSYTPINRRKLKPTDTLYLDKPGDPGAYYYRIQCIDKAGNESKSEPDFVEVKDIIPPCVPRNVAIKADTGIFIMRWDHCHEADLKGYVVMRSLADENNADNKYLPASEVIDTNYFEEAISPNMRAPYVYVIQSVDSALNRSEYSEEMVAQLPDVTPPVAPGIKTVQAEGEILRIDWVDNLEKDLKGYNIYRKSKKDTLGFTKLNSLMIPKDISSFQDQKVERGIMYEYKVIAVDFSGLESEPSNIGSGKVEFLALQGEVEFTKQKYNPLKKEVNLAWNMDGLSNEPIVGTAIFRSVNGGKSLQRGQLTDKTQYKEKITKPGQYAYEIRVYGSRGNILKSSPIQIEVKPE